MPLLLEGGNGLQNGPSAVTGLASLKTGACPRGSSNTQFASSSPAWPSSAVQLYYRLYPDLRGRNRYICLVVKRGADYSFILTGNLARSIKGE